MTKSVYPPEVYQKALVLEGSGKEPETIDLIIPTITVPDEEFCVKIALIDKDGFSSVKFEGNITVKSEEGKHDINFKKGQPCVGLIKGLRISQPGIYRLSADLNGKTFYSNPTCCTETPEYRIFWGDPHVHTHLSDCHADTCRSAHFGYIAGRWQTGLDFVGMADHVSWGDRITLGKWRTQVATSELHDDAPDYVTLPGYEVSLRGGSGGDNNVYTRFWPETWIDEWEGGTNKTLADKVEEMVGKENYIVVPHHTSRGAGKNPKHGEIPNENYPGEEALPVMEIHSRWGTSEYQGNPNQLKEPYDGNCYAVDFLKQGIRFGFIAGTDTHETVPSGDVSTQHLDAKPGFTAVFCQKLERDEVFDAIRKRNCYATSTERIYLDVTVDETKGGEIIKVGDTTSPRKIEVKTAVKSKIKTIEIIRNGEVIHTEKPDDWKAEFTFTDSENLKDLTLTSEHYKAFAYYYIRVNTEANGQAWSSPVWMDMG